MRRRALVAGLALAGVVGAVDAARGLDRAVPLVTIESRFVEVSDNFLRDLGIEWPGLAPSAQPLDPAKLPLLGKLFGGAGAGSDAQLDVLASPHATSQGGEPARIEVGSPDRVSVKLVIVPVVMDDERIRLDIRIQVDAPVLTEVSRTAKSQVVVGDGQAVVIGGLFSDGTRQAAGEVPALGDIPVLGHLFRKASFQRGERNLLIFIRPCLEGGVCGGRPARPGLVLDPQVQRPKPDPQLHAPSVPQAPHQPQPGYGPP